MARFSITMPTELTRSSESDSKTSAPSWGWVPTAQVLAWFACWAGET